MSFLSTSPSFRDRKSSLGIFKINFDSPDCSTNRNPKKSKSILFIIFFHNFFSQFFFTIFFQQFFFTFFFQQFFFTIFFNNFFSHFFFNNFFHIFFSTIFFTFFFHNFFSQFFTIFIRGLTAGQLFSFAG
jgi:hypothetical protein